MIYEREDRYEKKKNHARCFMWVWDLVSAKLSVFESSVLKKIFRPKTEEVEGDWRKLHNFVLCTTHQLLGW